MLDINKHSAEIKWLATKSIMANFLSLSHLYDNGNKLHMSHNPVNDRILFLFISNTGINRAVQYDYPYFKEQTPDRLVPKESFSFFNTEYKIVKGHIKKIPDYKEVERLIIKAVNLFANG